MEEEDEQVKSVDKLKSTDKIPYLKESEDHNVRRSIAPNNTLQQTIENLKVFLKYIYFTANNTEK